jgi:hypothetical protein
MSVHTILIFQNTIIIIIISMDMQTIVFIHCIFSIHQHLGIFCTMLHNLSRSSICSNDTELAIHALGGIKVHLLLQ